MKLGKKNAKKQSRHTQDSVALQRNRYFRSSESSYKRRELSSQVSYHDKAKSSRPTPQKKSSQRKTFDVSKLFSLLIVATVVGVLLYASSVSTGGANVVIQEDSFTFRPAEDYEAFVDSYVASHIATRSKLLFPVSEFNAAFVSQYPEVTKITTNVPFADRAIQVSIHTPPPLFRISGMSSSSNTLYVDANGTVVSSSVSDSSVPTMTVTSSALVDVGSQILTQNEIDILTLIQEEVVNAEIQGLPDTFSVSSADLDIRNGRLEVAFSGVRFTARFSTYSDARNQVGALKVTLRELFSSTGEGADDVLPKEYIDVRVYEKVFVR